MRHELTERNRVWVERFKAGEPHEAIAADYGVSRQRVQQLLRRYGLSKLDGGGYVTAKASSHAARLKKAMDRDVRTAKTFGCGYDEASRLNSGMPLYQGLAVLYGRQRNHALHLRGIEWKITFPEWVEVWRASGRLDARGRKSGQYVMARVMDQGPYAVGNVYIATCSDNSRLARALDRARLRTAITSSSSG
jgi:hypothetical protein